MGWVGWDLCAGLFYEHRFAMLINITVVDADLIVKAAELQSALATVASLPKSFSSQLSQYAQYSSLQQVF